MTESAELTARGAALKLPDDVVSVSVTIKVGGPDEIDWNDPLTLVCLAAGRWVTHDDEQAKRIAQYVVRTMRGLG